MKTQLSREKIKNFVEEFLLKKGIKNAQVLFSVLGGSHSYNLNSDKSDFDIVGVYLSDLEFVFSIDENKKYTISERTIRWEEDKTADILIYELSTFFHKLSVSEPKAFELLFIDEMHDQSCFVSKEWEMIRKERNAMIFPESVNKYMKDVDEKLKRVEKEKLKENSTKKEIEENIMKHFYHSFRMLFEAQSILESGRPIIRYEEGSEKRNFLMKIRSQLFSEEELFHKIQNLILQLVEKKKNIPREEENLETINEMVRKIRKMQLEEKKINEKLDKFNLFEKREEGELNQLKNMAEKLLSSQNIKEATVLCVCPSGSLLHFKKEDSKHDFFGVYILSLESKVKVMKERSTRYPLVVSEYAPHLTFSKDKIITKNKGCILIEFSHFFHLFINGENRCSEML